MFEWLVRVAINNRKLKFQIKSDERWKLQIALQNFAQRPHDEAFSMFILHKFLVQMTAYYEFMAGENLIRPGYKLCHYFYLY